MDTAQRGMGLDWAGAARADPPLGAPRRRRSAAGSPAASAPTSCTGPATPGRGPRGVRGAARRSSRRPARRPILMASRALAAAAHGPRGLPGASTATCCARPPSRSILHWLGPDVRPGAGGLLGLAPTSTRPPTPSSRSSPPTRTRSTASRSRCWTPTARSTLRRRLPQGVRCYTGDDFNYPELIAGDEQGFSHALLGIFDPLGPAGGRRRCASWTPGDVDGLPRAPRPDRRAVPPPLPDADPLLQDGRRVPGLAGRPPGPLHDGRRPAVGPLAAAPGARVRTRRRAGPVPGPGAGRGPDEAPCCTVYGVDRSERTAT